MKRFNDSKIMPLLLAFVLALMLSAASANADFTFGEPVNLGPTINSAGGNGAPCLSYDGLEFYFQRGEPSDMFVSRRTTPDSEWGAPVAFGPTVNTPGAYEGGASISADGLSLYFGSSSQGLFVMKRATLNDNWGTPVSLGINGYAASVSADELELYFQDATGGYGEWDVWVTTRASVDDKWGTPVNLGPTINTSYNDNWPGISPDGLVLFFASTRPGGLGSWELYMAKRATKKDPWGPPVNLGPVVNTTAWEVGAKVSWDGSTLYWHSARPGGFSSYDIWQAPIIPIVDFNGDGIIDMKDFSRLAQYWGQSQSSVDIGPMPWGDGTVDLKDLVVFSEYWLTPADPIGHWKLDEKEGWTAHDSAGAHDGFVMSANPLWRPADGRIDGALELDGIDDYVSTPFVLDPSKTNFSMFAWVKGGAAGQVIVSQINLRNWLSAEPGTGALMSNLTVGLVPQPLSSQAVITDGNWHRVGVSRDQASLILYVDGIEVAKKAQSSAPGSTGGLYIGAGKGLEAGSFWSGLIDDVRIYDRAITP